ncbi:probable inactive patatin-like protein 9 [Malania oleifera]|uniref:probable inactive patatin-like protein 9 n=1 Tax=Malania oleifera TaxID=397392 RepID=UPI0025AE04A5|nr:probable inactive patatin-like protein 9 [Malania oleifera]XP_057958854.1 probable inactive patatin-like protein 9 [Malania oleifera]XP_057958855.1 probable inactive patatin-like protein 9 [Malania oleifera]
MELNEITMEIFSNLERQWLSHSDEKKIRILSIDGGGTTVVVTGAALIHLEDQIQARTGNNRHRIADFFDLIAGSGIGAILAAMLVADDGRGRPLFTAREAVEFVTVKNSKMFKIKRDGIFYRRRGFSGQSMDKVLKEAFCRYDSKMLSLKDTCRPLLVPCYDLNTSAPFVFSRADAAVSPSFDFELWKVCRAASATPTLFEPFGLTSVDGKTSCLALDGGLVINNPTAAAVTHVLHNKRDFPSVNGVEDLLVLSLGNGSLSSSPNSPHGKRNDGTPASLIIGVALDGNSETIDQMLANTFCSNLPDYVRIQARGVAPEGLEEVLKEKGVESLPLWGKRLLTENNGSRIESFVQRLVDGKSSLPPSPFKETDVAPLDTGR